MSSVGRRFELSARGAVMFVIAIILLSEGRIRATNDENHIEEVTAGADGNSKIPVRRHPV